MKISRTKSKQRATRTAMSPSGAQKRRAFVDKPHQITARHLARLALVYVRRTAMTHLNANTGSTDVQCHLADLPRLWGWPESRIIVIDDDMGMSGSSSKNRPGYQRMVKLIRRGRVGLVLADLTRLSQNIVDAERFLQTAIRTGTLLYVNDRYMIRQ